ncbi:hypothetical protein AB0425_40560 [Actinosynnema sp. NPDC051121]
MARSRTWPAQPAALAAVLVLAAAGAAIGWRVGGPAGAVVGVGAALVAAVLLVIAADRLGSAPAGPRVRRRADGRRRS